VVWEIDNMHEQVATQLRALLQFAVQFENLQTRAVHANAALSTHSKA
jgi:hypothetical protein